MTSLRFVRRGAALALPLLAWLASAPPCRAERLELAELERQALARRSALSAARARTSAARAEAAAVRAARRPSLSVDLFGEMAPGGRLVRVRDVDGDEYLMTGSRELGDPGALTPDFRYGAELSLAAPIYDFGRTSAAARARDSELDAAGLDEKLRARAVVAEVRAAYLSWLYAARTRELLLENLRETRALREFVDARVAEGSLAGADASPARFDEARAELELLRAEAELEHARLGLERACLVKLGAGAEPDPGVLDVPAPGGATAGEEAAIIEKRRKSAAATAAAHRAAGRPLISGEAEVGLRGQGEVLLPLYRVGVAVTIPLLDGGVQSASERAAVSRANELAAEAEEARAQAQLELDRALATVKRAERQVAVGERLVAVARAALDQAKADVELGNAGREGVARARAQLSNAELELLRARVERARGVFALLGAKR